jgi:hypothetical protein
MTRRSSDTPRPTRHSLSVDRQGEWPLDRLAEARAVIADVAHHGNPLIRLACTVLVQHGETRAERADAERLLLVIDARRPLRCAACKDLDAGAAR